MKKYCTKLLAMTFLLVLSGILTGCSSAKGTDASDENQSETIAANVIAVPNEEVNSTDEAPDKLKLAVSLPSALSGWDADVIYYAEQRARELALLNGWSFEVSAAANAEGQSAQLLAWAQESNVAALVIYPWDSQSLTDSAKKVMQAGIPLVVFERAIDDVAPSVMITGDNASMGSIAADNINSTFSEGTTVLLLKDASNAKILERQQVFEQQLAATMTVEPLGYTDGQKETAKAIIKSWLDNIDQEALDKVGAIAVWDEVSSEAVLEALSETSKDLKQLKIVVAAGGTQSLCQAVKSSDGYQVISPLCSPQMIKEAVAAAARVILKEDVAPEIKVTAEIITKSNVTEYISDELTY